MNALFVALGDGLINGCVDGLQRHCVFLGNGVGDQHTALEAHILLCLEGSRQFFGSIHLIVNGESAGAGIEGRQLLCAVAQHRHALGFQIFQRQTQIQNALGTGAYHHHRGLCQLLQVRGNVHSGLRTTVHTADTACSKDLDACHMGNDHCGGNSSCTVFPTGAQYCQVTAGGFVNGLTLFAEIFNFLFGQTGLQPTADNGDGGRYRSVIPNDFFHLQCGFHILGVGHSVGDNGTFQCDHRLALSNGLCYFRFYIQKTIYRDHNLY